MIRACLISLTVLLFACFAPAAHAKPALVSVNTKNTIRCGYVEYMPGLVRDLGTGQWKGFDYDIMQAVGGRLQLAVAYTAATGWATVVTDLRSRKFDMLCSGFWVHPNVGKFALFSRPFFYQPVFIVARADDTRFGPETNLDDPALTMVALDGDNPVFIAMSDFPKAKVTTLPNMTDFSQVLVAVASGRADFTIVDGATFGAYNKGNPDRLRIVAPDHPVRVYPVSFAFGDEDVVFRDAVNAALDEMLLDGTIDRILDKYSEFPHSYYRVGTPYVVKK